MREEFGNVEYIDHKPDLIETSKDKKEKDFETF